MIECDNRSTACWPVIVVYLALPAYCQSSNSWVTIKMSVVLWQKTITFVMQADTLLKRDLDTKPPHLPLFRAIEKPHSHTPNIYVNSTLWHIPIFIRLRLTPCRNIAWNPLRPVFLYRHFAIRVTRVMSHRTGCLGLRTSSTTGIRGSQQI